MAIGLRGVPVPLQPVPAPHGERLPPAAGIARPQGVLRGRGDRVPAAPGPGGDAQRRHAGCAERHALLQRALRHLRWTLMYVIRLPNGNLLVPESVASDGGSLMSEAYVEIGPDDVDYDRLAADALTQEELDERRRRWQEGDESLRRQFLDFVARHGNVGWAQDSRENRDQP